jgi:curved DNA-binding protein CbpA
MSILDPYLTLSVEPTADRATIRAAYRALAWIWHPDRGGRPERMAAINEAWRVLRDSDRRAAYDAAVKAHQPSPEPTVVGQAPRMASARPRVLDFGRYEGWTLQDLVRQDPDYLAWLVRTPTGRHLAAEINTLLAERDRQAADLAPKPTNARRGVFGARWAAAR